MGSNQKRLISGISVFAILLGICIFAFVAGAQQGVDVVLANLQANAKLHAPDAILADFVNGEAEMAVIVLLEPTATAKGLAYKSKLSARVPAEFTGPGAATYYDLQDESVRAQLQATVTETVNRVIGELGATGITVTQRFSYQFGFAAKVTLAALERIVNSPDVVTVEKDHILRAHLAQGIPLMNATTVRGSYTGSGLSIAICDTGIDTSHPRLGGGGFPNSKVIGGYDTGDNDADPRPNSVSGQAHGTCCAGIAAGNLGTVGDYIGGVAPDAKLYAVKISTGNTGSAETSAMIAGWEWCITHKNDNPGNPIMIISTSFGGGRFTSTCDSDTPSMTTAAANAVAAGITIFASSGNDGYCDSIGWPACISYVNSVGAVYDANFGTYNPCVSADSCALKTPTSGCGTGWYVSESSSPDKVTAYSNSASFLTLFAPSNQAYTTDIVGAGGESSGDYDPTFGGTSAACPYAAGAAAVLQQAAKAKTGSYLTPAQVKTYLVNNGDNVTDAKVAVTKPRINLGRAVDALPSTPSLPAPILTAEPPVTPGTENTIYWSAVSAPADIALAVGSRQHPLQPVSKTLTSDDDLRGDDRSEPAQATLPLESVFVPQVEGEKVISDSGPLAPVTVFSETFEGDFPGSNWTLSSANPTWNDVNYDKHGGSWSGWCGGSSLNPANGYTDNMNAWMVYGPFSLADATSASVSFWYKNLSESGWDFFKWLASVNGVNFYGYQISGDQNSWRSQVFDLASVPTLGDLRGQPQVWIAFIFTSDGSISGPTYKGAYVDDVIITKDSSQPDLTTYKLANWNDKIPVGTTQLGMNEAHSYSGVYYDNQMLYFNWASINQGTAASGSYTVHVEVTGTGGDTWDWTIPSDAINQWWGLPTDQAVGPLAAGSHTFKVWVDYNNTVAESDESNNYYERTITVAATEVSYYAECADNSGFSSPSNSGWTTQRQWTFINLTPGQTYWYRVKAKSGTTESVWSNVEHSQQELSGTIQLSAATYSVNENGGSVTITVTRTGGSSGAVGVSYATSNGTATAGLDYTATSGTLSWADGDTGNKTFSIPILDDSTYEGNETVNLTLSSPTGGATLGSPSTGVLTIVENDPAPAGSLQFSSATYSVDENGGSVTITVTRTGGSSGTVGVGYGTSNGTATAGSDYTATSGTLSWANGDTGNKTFSIPILDDSTYEGNETVNLTLSSPTGGATLGSPSTAVLTIIENDPPCTSPRLVSMPTDAAGDPGQTGIVIPVNVDNASGIAGVDVCFSYDPAILTCTNAQTAALTTGFSLAKNITTGQVCVSMASPTAIVSGSGALINVTCDVSASAASGATTNLVLQSVSLFDQDALSICFTKQDGLFTVSEPCHKGDVNHDDSINSGDAILILRIAVGSLNPDTYQSCAADTNDSGSVNSADAILVLKAAVFLPTIFYLSPSSGPVGSPVAIKGWNFGDTQGSSTVKFNGVVAAVASWSKSEIRVNVPSAATSGSVMVTVGGVVSNPVPFTIGGATALSIDTAGEPSSILVGFPSKTGGSPGQRGVVVPIYINEAIGVAGGDIRLSYDPSVLRVSDVQLAESTLGFALVKTINPGEVRISLARATGIDVSDGSFIYVIFDVLSSAAIGAKIPLRLESVSLFDDTAQPIGSRTQEGIFSVGYCVSGQIADAKTGSPVSGVEVYFQDRFGTDVSTVMTDKEGGYIQCGFAPERTPTVKVLVKPSASGYRISPRKRSVKIVDHNVTSINFKARLLR